MILRRASQRMRAIMVILLCCGVAGGCDRAKQGAKNALNAGGEMAGTAATEVIEGVTTGVQGTWKVDVRLDPQLMQRGVSLGKTVVESDTLGNDNKLVVYLTTTRALRDTFTVMAFDKDSLEMGRARLIVDAAAGSGDYYDVHFPARTDLERKSWVLIH